MSDAAWREALVTWADDYARRLASGSGRDGVIIGGSIARHQHWEHSDLEVGVLVDDADPEVTHFSTDSGRGVETFQLRRADLARQLDEVRQGDLEAVAAWPVQLWRGRVTHDPSGLLGEFTAQFESHLLSPVVVERRLRAHRVVIGEALAQASQLLDAGRPAAALTLARKAMNELIQIAYWQHGEVPRSQNRTASRFRALAAEHGLDDLYRLFWDVFGLDNLDEAVTDAWPRCREQVLALTELWEGRRSRDFFTVAVDSNFEWGENDGIICVYRLYVPLMGRPERGVFNKLDDPGWRAGNQPLLKFLALDPASEDEVQVAIKQLAAHLDSP